MISNYVRDNSFFQSLSESNNDISYKDFDKELNDFISYTNRKVVTAINNIGSNNYNGVVGNNNYILRNIGDGKVVFDKLKDSNFKDNSIGLTKIDFVQPYSLIFVNSKYELMYHSITNDNHDEGGIFGNFDTHMFYQYGQGLKIEGKNFYDKQILASNIEANTIGSWHINPDGQTYLINNVIVDTRHIINNSIGVDKFALYGITYDKLHPDIKNFREKLDTYLTYENNSITADKIKNNSFDFRLISTNLAKFGYRILHKNVIPVNSVPIAKPDQYAGETIDTYKLCIYSIANAYQLNTYTKPQPDKVYVNPAYTEKLNLYNSVNKQLIDANNYLNQLYNRCVYTNGFAYITEQQVLIGFPLNISKRNTYLQYARDYQAQLQFYNNLYAYLVNINADLQKIPQNIYTPVPPIIYQKLEAVPNTKSYLRHRDHQVIKSRHLKYGFSLYNFPNRTTHLNVPSWKFINKYCLSPELRTKLGLVI